MQSTQAFAIQTGYFFLREVVNKYWLDTVLEISRTTVETV